MRDVPPAFWIAAAAAFGAVIGSFCNVCIYRLPRRCLSVVGPASRCPACLQRVAWHDNIPIFSFLALGGRCRRCRVPIGWRYPAVEALTAAAFAAAAHFELADPADPAAGPSAALVIVHAGLLAALVVATFVDFEFRIIPDQITKPGIGAGLLASVAIPSLQRVPLRLFPADFALAPDRMNALATGLAGALWGWLLLKSVRVLGELVFRKEAMGLGDVKYMAMLGAFLGPHTLTLIFFLGCCFGSVWGGARFLVTRDHYIAFGPFLSMAALVMVLAGEPVLEAVAAYVQPLTGGAAWP